jgi:hypothetical protein
MNLERVALNQTRLRTPGLRLDAKGVALGAKGLVLLPSLDRLVGFLSLYTASASLADVLPSLAIDVVKSKLGAREVALSFAAETSERMDRAAELVRLCGGYAFTGTQRHFVQYRDAASPFGYDLGEMRASDSALSLSHTSFTQDYQIERRIDLAALLLKLEPRVAPETLAEAGARWICAESGLGPALIHYFVRSSVAADVGVCEWPPASELEPAPIRRYLFRVPALPERMAPLLGSTPGLTVFVPSGPGTAVELGWRHPINLRACPVFPDSGLVLIRAPGRPALRVDNLPALGPVVAFARVALEGGAAAPTPGVARQLDSIGLAVRLTPDPRPLAGVTATLVDDLALLRMIAYRVGRSTLRDTHVAFTDIGALLICERGIEAVPVGEFFTQIHRQLFVSAGHCVTPAVDPEVLFTALGSPDAYVFLHRDGRRIGVARSAFVPLQTALLDAHAWSGLTAEQVAAELDTPIATVALDPPGFRPMRDVARVDSEDA